MNTFKFLKRTFTNLNSDCIFIISKFLGKRMKIEKIKKIKVFEKRKEKYQRQIFISFRKLSF
jgi:hypothetical protein